MTLLQIIAAMTLRIPIRNFSGTFWVNGISVEDGSGRRGNIHLARTRKQGLQPDNINSFFDESIGTLKGWELDPTGA